MIPFLTTYWKKAEKLLNCWTSFDGLNEYVDCGNDSSLNFERTDSFSFSVWVEHYTNTSNNVPIIGKFELSSVARGILLRINDGKIAVNIGNDGFGGTNSITFKIVETVPINNFNNIILTYNGNSDVSGVAVYLNSVKLTINPIGLINTLTDTILTTRSFKIGSYETVYGECNIDEVRVYNTELTPTQVTDIYNRGRNNVDYSDIPGIVSHWKMDTLNPIDRIGVNNGTSINMDSSNIICA